jgi:YidC/Oxa1 family membrane protein insertase
MCQQFYVIRRMPAPGSPAEQALQDRHRKRGKEAPTFTVKGLDAAPSDGSGGPSPVQDAVKKSGQRQQPKRKKRSKATGGGSGKSDAVSNTGSTPEN